MTIRTNSGGAEFRGSGLGRGRGALLCVGGGNVKTKPMDDAPKAETRPNALTREERLAARLRENLKRRKEQSRALADTGAPTLPKADTKS